MFQALFLGFLLGCQVTAESDFEFIVVGGKPGNRPSEVFKSPDEPIETLNDSNDFPYSFTNILGFNHDGKYHVIGGDNSGDSKSKESSLMNQLFTFNGKSWIPEDKYLQTSRYHAAIGQTPTGNWWITGGFDVDGKILKETELTDEYNEETKTFTNIGPELPWPTYGHCMVNLQDLKRVLIIGGYHGRLNENFGISSDVWSYEFLDGTDPMNVSVTQISSLNVARSKHSCGILRQSSSTYAIVVAGGFGLENDGSPLNSVEVLEVSEKTDLYRSWNANLLEPLPSRIHSAALIPSLTCGSLTLLGGFDGKMSKTVYTIDYAEKKWKRSNHDLLSTRSDFAVIPKFDSSKWICDPTNVELISKKHILLLGGNAESETFGEVITSDGSSCQYSGIKELYHGMGGLFENVPIYCGGTTPMLECYQLEGESFVAQPNLMLETPLKSAAYTSYRDQLVFVGGDIGLGQMTDRISLLGRGYNFQLGSLPFGLSSQCMVGINEDTFVITGGYESGYIWDKTYIMTLGEDQNSQIVMTQFDEVSNMLRARSDHACGLLEEDDGRKFVVVAGGIHCARTCSALPGWWWSHGSVECLEVTNGVIGSWQTCPDFPLNVTQSAMVTDPNTGDLLLLGGAYSDIGISYEPLDTIYRLTSISKGWELIDQNLMQTRTGHVAFSVSEEHLKCD